MRPSCILSRMRWQSSSICFSVRERLGLQQCEEQLGYHNRVEQFKDEKYRDPEGDIEAKSILSEWKP